LKISKIIYNNKAATKKAKNIFSPINKKPHRQGKPTGRDLERGTD